MSENKKGTWCLVHGCDNCVDMGSFIGNLCLPCYEMLLTGEVSHGRSFIHDMNKATEQLSKAAKTLADEAEKADVEVLKNKLSDAINAVYKITGI